MLYVLAYDLKEPNDKPADYDRVIKAIHDQFGWAHIEKSVFLITSTMTAAGVRDYMNNFIKKTDRLVVARLTGEWASWGLSQPIVDWLNDIQVA